MPWLRWIACSCLLLKGMALAVPAVESVAVLFNESDPESRKLAEIYREVRNIPPANLIGLPMPAEQTITRAQYDSAIAGPLRKVFERRGWWLREKDAQGVLAPTSNRIRVLVTVRGVPLRISRSPVAEKAPVAPPAPGAPPNPMAADEAAVDSELAMLGVEGVPAAGPMNNAYFRVDRAIQKAGFPHLMLTARLDAPTYATCERMIRDVIEVEKTGLWGMSYVDIANKFPQGDQWLEAVVKQNVAAGLPTVVDRFNPTLPTHYPMRDAAMYFGWYDRNLSGPFLNPAFRLRKGAVAMHLHSFTAEQMRNPALNWSGGLLECGAAVTIGNVYEPYLHLTHDFGLLHQYLLAGYSWGEACWMSIPCASWQGVVLGDPLYQPFAHLDGSGEVRPGDVEYRALRAAMLQWKDKPGERIGELKQAAIRMKSGRLFEAIALESLETGDVERARSCFLQARDLYVEPADQLRQDLHVAAILRRAGQNSLAGEGLRLAAKRYATIPEIAAVNGWLDILDPPAPPPPTAP